MTGGEGVVWLPGKLCLQQTVLLLIVTASDEKQMVVSYTKERE